MISSPSAVGVGAGVVVAGSVAAGAAPVVAVPEDPGEGSVAVSEPEAMTSAATSTTSE